MNSIRIIPLSPHKAIPLLHYSSSETELSNPVNSGEIKVFDKWYLPPFLPWRLKGGGERQTCWPLGKLV